MSAEEKAGLTKGGKHGEGEREEAGGEQYQPISIGSLFRFANGVDMFLLMFGSIGACLQGAAMPAFSLIFGELMEGLNDPNPIEASRKTMDASWLFLWTAIGMFITTGINVACFEMLADRQLVNYRREYFSAVLRMDIAWFDLKGGLDLPSSISGDASLLREGIGMKFGQGVMGFATFVLSYLFAFLRGWQLAAVMCASIPALAIVVGVGATFMGKMAAMSTEAYSEAGAVAEENLGNMRTVAAFGGEETARQKFDKLVTKAKTVGVRSAHASGANMGAMMAVMFASYALGFWYGGKMVTDADRLHNSWTDAPWTGGDVMATFFAALMGGMMAGQMGPTFSALLAARGAGGKMYSIVDTVPNIDPASTAGQEPADGGMGEIEFRGASFRYPSRPDVPLFDNLNLTIPGGKTTALVGESGSGKSTVIALIQRFYDLDGGAVTIDGVNLKDIKLPWVRKTLGLVSQEPVLFATSIIDNIRYGRLDATDEEIFDAARKANAYDFIMKFDDKFNTYVGEKGSQISGGQKQRIAIARALLHKPKVLLLDEATSALDNQSQREVQDTINQIISNEKLTVVVIAHRLSTVKDADKICVFERGALVQEGSHDELMNQSIPNNVYKNLVAGQDTVAAQDASVPPAEAGSTTAPQKMTTASDSSRVSGQELTKAKNEDTGDEPEHEYEQTWNNGDIIAASGGHGLLIIGLLAAIVAGVAMPVWAIGFSDITLAFYMCEPWSPAVFLQELQADQEFADAVSDRFSDAKLPEPIDGDWNTALMQENAAPYTMVYGSDPPFGFGVYNSQEACFADQVDRCNMAALFFLLLGIGLGLAEYFKNMAYEAMKQTAAMNLRKQLFSSLLKQEIGFFDETQNTSGALTSRLSADTALVSGVLGPQMGSAFQSLVTLVVGMIVAFTASWRLALSVLGFMPLLTISAKIQNDMFMGLADNASSSSAVANQLCSESIQGIRTVRAFNIEKQVLELYETLVSNGQGTYKKAITSGLGAGASQMLMFALYWVAFFYGGWLIKGVGASGNDIMTSFMAMMMAGFGIGMASMAVPDKAKSAAAANAVFAMIRRQTKIEVKSGDGPSFDGAVHLQGVEFAYPSRLDRPILKTVHLSIAAGKTTALVGPSGSGKSTIVAMLQRFYDPTGGALVLGGCNTDLRSVPLAWWREQIGFVGQEPVLFKGTIADNIKYGNPDATVAMIETAARKAFAHDFIMNKTRDKYETQVGERGGTMSGGQKQRIAIARALVRNPKLLLLDEATSALDNESEHEVQTAIDAIIEKESMTCVVIAHRLNTIKAADMIVVFEDGVLLEQGTHDALVNDGGLYAQLAGHKSTRD